MNQNLKGRNLSANASLQVNRRLNNQGRNITFRGTFSYGDNDSEQFSESLTRYFDDNAKKEDDERKQYTTSPTKNYDYTAELTYSEPIARATFLQFRYKFQYKYSESDRSTYSLIPDADKGQDWFWNFGDSLPVGYEENKDRDLSKYAQSTAEHQIDYKKAEVDTVVKEMCSILLLTLIFVTDFLKSASCAFTYRGRKSAEYGKFA